MRIVPNANGEFLVILQDNHVCCFTGARPQRANAPEDEADIARATLGDSIVTALQGLAESLKRGRGFRRAH